MQVEKRNGSIVEYDNSKIIKAVKKAFRAMKEDDTTINEDSLITKIKETIPGDVKKVEDIQDAIVVWLHENGYHKVGIAFTKYRERRALSRENSFDSVHMVEEYLGQLDDMAVHENSSTMYSLQGLNNHIFSSVSEKYWLNQYSDEIKEAFNTGRIHIHDLQSISAYCAGWDLKALLTEGFGGVSGKPASAPPKHLSTALNQANNFIFTIQGELSGAVAFSNFNTLMAPFVRVDNLSYNQVKQEIQEFIFNLNISTRVGFQCLSEDTEILTADGWKTYNEITVGDNILTYKINDAIIEENEVQNVFKEKYDGDMIQIKEQLLTPNHRCIAYDTKNKKEKFIYASNLYNYLHGSDEDIKFIDYSYTECIENLQNLYEDLEYKTKKDRHFIIPGYSESTDFVRSVGKITAKDVMKVPYSGVVWCPTTENGTVIARRNGKCFITGNSPFSNLTLDLDTTKVKFAEEPAVVGGELMDFTYADVNKEATWINQAIVEVLGEGDKDGAMLSYPIVTFNVTDEFPWHNKLGRTIQETTAKYGCFYFANYISSDHADGDITSMCCRLKINRKDIEKHLGEYTGGLESKEYDKAHQKGHGFFGASPNTGSIGVGTLGIPAIMYDTLEAGGTWDDFLQKIKYYMDLIMESLMKKRKIIEHRANQGLYPYLAHYLRDVKKRTGHYFTQHFSTICTNGVHEALYIYGLKDGIICEEGISKAEDLLKFMNDYTIELQKEHKVLVNLEQAPAESASIKMLNKSGIDPLNNGYWTNSTWQPSDAQIDLVDLIQMQARLNVYYSGGSSMHTYTQSDIVPVAQDLHKIIMYAFTETKMPYMTISPVFSVCEKCGRLPGKHEICPKCGSNHVNIYERIVGYYRPHKNWNQGKLKESKKRNYLDIK